MHSLQSTTTQWFMKENSKRTINKIFKKIRQFVLIGYLWQRKNSSGSGTSNFLHNLFWIEGSLQYQARFIPSTYREYETFSVLNSPVFQQQKHFLTS